SLKANVEQLEAISGFILLIWLRPQWNGLRPYEIGYLAVPRCCHAEMPHKRIYFDGEVVSVPISPYQYKPLIQIENEFRLVELQPNHSHHIKATLRHYSLLDPPSYTALSYQCGDPRNL